MACKRSGGINVHSLIQRCLQLLPSAQLRGEPPLPLADACDIDAGLDALHEQPNRAGPRVDRRHRGIVSGQDRAPDLVGRTIRSDETNRGMRHKDDAALVGRIDCEKTREIDGASGAWSARLTAHSSVATPGR